jgi:hypothetical protein
MKLEPAIELAPTLKFKTTESILTFIKKEIGFWDGTKNYNDTRNSPLFTSAICEYLHETITNILNQAGYDENRKNQELRQCLNHRTFNVFSFFQNYYLPSNNPITIMIRDIAKKHGSGAAHAFWITSRSGEFKPVETISKENFLGIMLAYEHSIKESDLPKRRSVNKRSIKEYQDELEKVNIEVRDQVSDLLSESNTRCSELLSDLSDINSTASKQLKDQLVDQSVDYDQHSSQWKNRISELEILYEEKLRLKKPADYWKKAASKHERLAVFASTILAVVAFISTSVIGGFFYRWVETFGEPTFKPASLQGVLMFAVIVAIIAFVLKILSRIIFSSLHLARDADEREQLTYFYLSLKNESEMSDQDRNLVLTALFSRSETGLLTNEHGPKMPMSEIMKSRD